jgi:hypothetical protein
MRRLDLHPRRKLRNPGRHLRQLARWPEWIVEHLLDQDWGAGERYRNCKVPVFAKLVEPPHATLETQRACIAALFAAAEAMECSDRRPRECRVACLVTTPFLFESEVTLFFDEDYFPSFLPVAKTQRTEFDARWIEAEPADPSAIAAITPPAPAGLEFFGGTRLREFDPEWGDMPVERNNWVWAFPRR